jgi:hypothetical protein
MQQDLTRTMDSSEDAPLLFGTVYIEYAEQGPEAGEDEGKRIPSICLSVWVREDKLVLWARSMRTDEDLFPEGEVIGGFWVTVTPTIEGRIPWENGDLDGYLLLLEGEVPDHILEEYDEDITIKRVPSTNTH